MVSASGKADFPHALCQQGIDTDTLLDLSQRGRSQDGMQGRKTAAIGI